jgi:hydrogenase maturation protease
MADAPAVVIGVGNPLRGDDAAGVRVARLLRGRAHVIEQSGEASALADALRQARAAYIVDAACGERPGRVHRLDAAARPLPPGMFTCSTHGLGVAEGVELARALGVLPPVCVVYAIEGARFETGAAMSAALEAALPAVAACIDEELQAAARANYRRAPRSPD